MNIDAYAILVGAEPVDLAYLGQNKMDTDHPLTYSCIFHLRFFVSLILSSAVFSLHQKSSVKFSTYESITVIMRPVSVCFPHHTRLLVSVRERLRGSPNFRRSSSELGFGCYYEGVYKRGFERQMSSEEDDDSHINISFGYM